MAYISGALLALSIAWVAKVTRFDRDRSFYPTLLIVIASYYVLFAVIAQSSALIVELLFALFFAVLAFVSAYVSVWFVVAGLVLHGAFDYVHDALITNAGVPTWWSAFCLTFDVVLALWLAWLAHQPNRPA